MGMGSKAQTVGYRYSFDIHFALGKAMDGLLQIRASGKTAWSGVVTSSQSIFIDAPTLFGGDKGEGGIQGWLDVMFGDEDQEVNPRLAAAIGGLVPAFRGFVGGFFSGLVTSLNPYPKPWEFQRWRALKGWDGAVWYPETCLITLAEGQVRAMNPAHILYETYTNSDWGRGLDRSMMDDAAFRAAAATLFAEGFGLCLEWKVSTSLADFRDQVCNHVGAYVGPDRRTGLITLHLIRDDYDVDALPLYDEDSGLLSIEEDESSSNLVAPSQLIVRYDDAITGETRRARAVNTAIAQAQGGPSAETIEYPGLPTADLAGRVAARDMRIKGSNLRRFKIVLDRRGWREGPGSVFRIRSLKRGIGEIVVRTGKIEDGTLDSGAITITALQDVFGLPASNFVPVPPSGWVPPDTTPRAATLRRLVEVPYRDLAGVVDPANLAILDPTSGWVATLAAQPSGLSQSYTITSRPSAGAFVERAIGHWCPTALLVSELLPGATLTAVASAVDLEDVEVGMAALIDDEVVRVDAVNATTGVLTLGRGCADTIPAKHLAGARIWFYDGSEGEEGVEYSAGVTVQVKMLTNTSSGQLAEGLAQIDSLTVGGRQGRPYPPGLFKINGASWPTSIYGPLTTSWAHRDRLMQADQLIDYLQGSIGPEAGQTYRLRIYSGATLKRTYSGIAGTSLAYAASDDVVDGALQTPRLVLDSNRDGLSSWQAYDITLDRHGLGFHLGEELGGTSA